MKKRLRWAAFVIICGGRRKGAMGFPRDFVSVGLGVQGPQHSAFRSISLSEPMQHDRSINIITSFAGKRIGWNAADSGIGPSIH